MSKSLTPTEAQKLATRALAASGVSEENARSVANALVLAEMSGQAGHGLRRLSSYAGQSKSGKVDGHAVPKVTHRTGNAMAIDAGGGFAYPALDLAVREVRTVCESTGIAICGIRRSHHAGVAGLVVEKLAEAGLVGLFMTNSPGAMSPWNGKSALFGTNPIAFAAPVGNAPPLVIDVSLSKVARGKVMAAAQKGDEIPSDWAFDANGHPTTDPDAALAGTMAPLGDAKGTALALMVEILVAALTGAAFAYEQSSFFSAEGDPPNTGQVLIGINPSAFGAANAVDRIAEIAGRVAEDGDARLPGQKRLWARDRAASEGIVLDDALRDQIEALLG